MKKIIIIAAALFLSYISNAQEIKESSREKLVFGLKAGSNLSNVYDQQGENFVADPKVGFAGGGFLGIPIGKYLGLQPEVLLSQKGYRSTGTMLGGSYSDVRTTSFLDIPLQIQFKPIELFTFLGGVQYSYLLHQRDVYTFSSTNSVAQEQEFKNDNVRKNIFGAVLGMDVNLSHFIISGKACWDLEKNVGNGSSYTPRYKNIWLQLTFGFRLYR